MQACLTFEAKVQFINFNTASLYAICARCNEDTDTRFAPTVNQLILRSTKYFIV